MINGRIVVVLARDKATGEMKFVFPEEEDRALACFELAKIAMENERNVRYKNDLGHLRNLFLGVTYMRLYRSTEYPIEEEVIVLKRKTEEIKFIIGEEIQK